MGEVNPPLELLKAGGRARRVDRDDLAVEDRLASPQPARIGETRDSRRVATTHRFLARDAARRAREGVALGPRLSEGPSKDSRFGISRRARGQSLSAATESGRLTREPRFPPQSGQSLRRRTQVRRSGS